MITIRTRIWLFTSVNYVMLSEIELVPSLMIANRTSIGLEWSFKFAKVKFVQRNRRGIGVTIRI